MNAPANIPAAQVRPAVRVLQDGGGNAFIFDAGSDEGRKECARFFGGLGLSDAEIAQRNRIAAKERANTAALRSAGSRADFLAILNDIATGAR